MSDDDEISFSDDDLPEVTRIFPLPNLVVFPYVMQPLHIFEPRYRAMLEAALASDKLITMALLAPGWERDYEGRPPVYPVACLCRVATHQKLESGDYNVLLIGLRRVQLVEELPPDRLFREVRIELLPDDYPAESGEERAALHKRLLEAFQVMLPRVAEAQHQLDQLLGGEISLGMLTDIVSYTLDLNVRQKQQLLAEANVDRRAELLLGFLKATEAEEPTPTAGFPPDFSAN